MDRLKTAYRRNKELWLAVLAICLITVVYSYVISWSHMAAPSVALFTHWLGILGFVLMLLTETVYSIRKTRPNATREALTPWFQFHIFTGLVGPFLVLLHSTWKFQGLAGVTLLLTMIMVVSGFVGRYIYSSVNRALAAVETGAPAGKSRVATLAQAKRLLAVWRVIHITLGLALFLAAFVHVGAVLYFKTLLR